jgi:hypothetical protein
MPQYITDPDLLRQLGAGSDPFDSALKAEGVSGKVAEIARSIYQQESSGGRNTKTSNAGAVGGMQIIPDTFRSVADKDWKINDPEQNARAGIRYVKQLYEQAGGDPALTAAGYYGGPGGLEKARRGIAVSDPRNPNAPTTLQYGQQVAARLPKERGVVQRAVEAMIPSAQAAEAAPARQYIEDPELLAQLEDKPVKAPEKSLNDRFLQGAGNVGAGLIRGAGSIGATLLAPIDIAKDAIAGKGLSLESNRARRADMDSALQSLGADPESIAYQGGKLVGEVAGTAGAGNVLAIPARAAGAGRLATALASSGAKAGAGSRPTNMLLRIAGGAGAGAAGAGLIDPANAGVGALVGGALPPVASAVGAVGRAAGSVVRPFYAAGQNQIAGDALRQAAINPAAARTALQGAQEIVPGSAPTAATAAGDDGIAALSRAMQNASPEYAAGLSARQTAQNQARTAAIEDIAGNTGKIALAKDARKALTDPMREEVLSAAGNVPSESILKSIDRLISKPDNAGELSQQALNKFRTRIEQFSKDGAIDARALYEIRKDINTTLQGKLQGDAGNLKYASSQLTNVKGLIDDAIDQASRRVSSPAASAPLSASREVVPFEAATDLAMPGSRAVGPAGAPPAAQAATGARPTWRGYLKAYTDESIPIGQMEKLDEILKSVQTGTVDSQGGAILSAAKLNNVLKNQGDDLAKDLSASQLDVLRRIQADLNAGQIANNTGRAVGSNTVQNLAQNQLLQGMLGRGIGGSTAATSTLGRLLQLPYGTANKQIQERLGNALLDPQQAARLLQDPAQNALLKALSGPAQIGYKAAPAITSR